MQSSIAPQRMTFFLLFGRIHERDTTFKQKTDCHPGPMSVGAVVVGSSPDLQIRREIYVPYPLPRNWGVGRVHWSFDEYGGRPHLFNQSLAGLSDQDMLYAEEQVKQISMLILRLGTRYQCVFPYEFYSILAACAAVYLQVIPALPPQVLLMDEQLCAQNDSPYRQTGYVDLFIGQATRLLQGNEYFNTYIDIWNEVKLYLCTWDVLLKHRPQLQRHVESIDLVRLLCVPEKWRFLLGLLNEMPAESNFALHRLANRHFVNPPNVVTCVFAELFEYDQPVTCHEILCLLRATMPGTFHQIRSRSMFANESLLHFVTRRSMEKWRNWRPLHMIIQAQTEDPSDGILTNVDDIRYLVQLGLHSHAQLLSTKRRQQREYVAQVRDRLEQFASRHLHPELCDECLLFLFPRQFFPGNRV